MKEIGHSASEDRSTQSALLGLAVAEKMLIVLDYPNSDGFPGARVISLWSLIWVVHDRAVRDNDIFLIINNQPSAGEAIQIDKLSATFAWYCT